MKGNVESKFLYAIVDGSGVVPFATITLPMAVLPIEPRGQRFRLVDHTAAEREGSTGLASWLEDAEKVWSKARGEKLSKMDLYASLDYSSKLTKQRPKARFMLVYNASGMYLCATVIRQETVSYTHLKLPTNKK